MRTLIAVLLLIATPAAAQTVWRGVSEYPGTAVPGDALKTLAAQLAPAGIDLRFQFDAPDGLRSATIPDAVQAGRIEVGDAFAGALSGLDPIFQLSSLPFLATSIEDAWKLYQAAKPTYTLRFAARGQRLLYAAPWPASGIWSRDSLAGPASLHDLPIRTYDAASTQALRAAGADAVQLSFADAMPRLADGSVTAVLSSGDGGAGRRLWEFTRHFTAVGYAMPLSFATVSDTAYDALTAEQRLAVDRAGAETERLQWQGLRRRIDDNYKTMRANGVSIETPDPAIATALAQAGAKVITDWATHAGPDAAAILNAYRK
jgi:TRAP-type C4-dicarboxylate transport system substrate-binding protein